MKKINYDGPADRKIGLRHQKKGGRRRKKDASPGGCAEENEELHR